MFTRGTWFGPIPKLIQSTVPCSGFLLVNRLGAWPFSFCWPCPSNSGIPRPCPSLQPWAAGHVMDVDVMDCHSMCGISKDPSLCFVVCQCFKKINRVSVCSDPWLPLKARPNRGSAPLVPTEVLVITGHRRWPSWRPWHGSGCESLGYRRRLGHIGYLKIPKRS